jgi:hypothetical protein
MSISRRYGASTRILCFILAIMGACAAVRAQVSSTRPANFIEMRGFSFGFGPRIGPWRFQTNEPDGGEQKFIDSDTVRVIAKACRLSDEELASVQVVVEPKMVDLAVYQIGKSDKAFRLLCPPLEKYVQGRREGHTKEFLLEHFK